jgi:type II secretory pathway pseudopilin PulG
MTKRAAKISDRLGRVASHLLLVLAVSAFAATGAIAASSDAAQQQLQHKQKQQIKTNQQQLKQAEKQQTKTNQQQLKQAEKQAQTQHFDWDTYHPGQRPRCGRNIARISIPGPISGPGDAPRHYETHSPASGLALSTWNYGQVCRPHIGSSLIG